MNYISIILTLTLAHSTIFCTQENNFVQERLDLGDKYVEDIRTFLANYSSQSPVSNKDFSTTKKSLAEKIIEESNPKKLSEYFGQDFQEKREQAFKQIYNDAKSEEERTFINTPKAKHLFNIASSGIVISLLFFIKGKTSESKPDYVNNIFNTFLGGVGANMITSIRSVFGYSNRSEENKKIIAGYELREKNITIAKEKTKIPLHKTETKNRDKTLDELLETDFDKDCVIIPERKKQVNNDNDNDEYIIKYTNNNKKLDKELDVIDFDDAEKKLNKYFNN